MYYYDKQRAAQTSLSYIERASVNNILTPVGYAVLLLSNGKLRVQTVRDEGHWIVDAKHNNTITIRRRCNLCCSTEGRVRAARYTQLPASADDKNNNRYGEAWRGCRVPVFDFT